MLFPYTYVPHRMEKMQEFIDFIFYKVWCKALTREYGIHLFEPCEPLYQIMNELYRRDLADKLTDGAGKWFYQAVNDIFNEFKKLDGPEIDEYCQCYQGNNRIEELCTDSPEADPVQYSDLNPSKTDLNTKLSEFFKKLYSSGFFGLAFVKNALEADLNEYYDAFIRVNDHGCCPFCGLLPMDSEFDPTREAFDHYLPKSKYPFNSVNLKNLAPSCYKCNSGNKRDQDPLHNKDGNRRKAFFPFSGLDAGVHVSIDLHIENWEKSVPDDLTISITSDSHSDEIETWKDFFRIEKRYLARCCSSDGVYWRTRVLDEYKNYNKSIKGRLDEELETADKYPWNESNFLKKAFLEGCQRAGLFDVTNEEEARHDR